jgi:MFS family permease
MIDDQLPEERDNFRHLVMDIAWFAVALASTSRFLQFYAIRLGADAFTLGLLTSLPSIVLFFSTGMSVWWRNRYENSIRAVWWPSIGFRMVFLLPVFAPFFPQAWRVWVLIIGAILPAITQGVSSSIFVVMMRETVSERRIGALLSRRQFALNIMLLLGVIGFGILLNVLSFPINYQMMFLLAFGFSMLSQWHLGRLMSIIPQQEKPKQERQSFGSLVKATQFQSVAYMTLICFVGFFSVFAIIPLYLERALGADEGAMALFGIAELLAGVLLAWRLDYIMQRLGSRMTIVWGMMATALAALVIAFAPNITVSLIGAVLIGAGWNGVTVAILNFFTERTEVDDMQSAMVFHQLIFAAMFIGPMIGSGLVSLGLSLFTVLLIGAGIRLLAALLAHQGLALFGKKRVAPAYSTKH